MKSGIEGESLVRFLRYSSLSRKYFRLKWNWNEKDRARRRVTVRLS